MKNKLPARPNLDHLRRQAKALLAALAAGEKDAVATIREHLPAARKLSEAEIRQSRFRLADAQSAIARKTGFDGWPHLARHVEQLRALEGTWSFARLQLDGSVIPAAALTGSHILIDGDRFRTESPEAIYEGIFNINVEVEPHEMDIEFVAGPEAGKWNFGIFRLNGDELEICLDINGKPRPERFEAGQGSGHAFETLRRTQPGRPDNVTGGAPVSSEGAKAADGAGFEFVESATLSRLQGNWSAVQIRRDGQDLPGMMLRMASRVAKKNEVRITVAGQLVVEALVKIDESKLPIPVDYWNTGGACKGTIQYGLMKWVGEEAAFCMSAPGQSRPEDFEAPAGSGRTFSQWKQRAGSD